MKFRSTAIMTALLVIVATLYFFDSKHREKKEQQETEAKKIYALDQKAISGLSIERTSGEAIKLQRRDGQWFLTEPVEAAADNTTVESMIEALTDTNRNKAIESPGELKEYGLDSPSLKLTVQQTSATPLPILALGEKNFSGYEIFGRFEGDKEILILDEIVKTRLDKTIFDLREKNIMKFDVADVRKFRIRSQEGELIGEKKESGEWFLNGDQRLRGDQSKIEELLRTFSDCKVAGFVDEKPADYSLYGLTLPNRSFSVWIGEDLAELTLDFGASITKANPPDGEAQSTTEKPVTDDEEQLWDDEPEDDFEIEPTKDDATTDSSPNLYAKRNGANNVVELSSGLLERLVPYTARLRDTSVIVFERSTIQRIELEKAGEPKTVCVRSDENQWNIIEPIATRADSGQINSLLNNLASTKAIGFLDDIGEDLTPYMLVNPDYRITISETDGANPQVVSVGGSTSDDGIDYRYVKHADVPYIYKVKPDETEKWNLSVTSLRDKRLMDYIKTDLRSLHVKGPKGELDISSRDGKKFIGRLKENRELTESEIDTLIWSFDFIEAKSILAEGETLNPAAYGLEAPLVSVEVTTKDKSGERLLIGPMLPDQTGYPVMKVQDKWIGLVEPATFEELFTLESLFEVTPIPSDK